jgi:hypothetical protein
MFKILLGCGGNLHTSSGAVISPNYPQNYYHQAICTWNIRVSAGSVIRIAFIDFDIEDHTKCSFDYIEISDIINGYVQNTQRFCGTIIPPFLLSNSNQIKLIFRSDVMASSRGFHLRYTTGEIEFKILLYYLHFYITLKINNLKFKNNL